MLLGAIKFSDSIFRLAEMKTIVALIFLGILTLAHLSSSKKCEAMENIDSQKFFSGTWFVTHAKKGFSTILCREITFKKNDSTVESNTKGKVRERTTKKEYTVHCTGTENKGKVPFKCTREEGEGSVRKLEYNEEFIVAKTDYGNFAVVCTNKAENDENVLVINKKKDADFPSAASDMLKKLDLKSENLKTRKSYKCE
ncbi:triabin-like [Rhodnius prolixus]|uniref:triabin-like n=1 Tax=Rhodnius prolixus TaxID=13249 RepID=UPI003D187FF8